MHIILGATGHVGSAVARRLLAKNEPVTVVTHSAEKSQEWQDKGARVAIVDVHNTEKLHRLFKQGQRIFLLNPPADPATDWAMEEKRTLNSILNALEGIDVEKVVGESAYGAHEGQNVGDLSTLYEMETGLDKRHVPHSIIRAAYYMSNWDNYLPMAKTKGKIQTFYPKTFKLPMVAPDDIGEYASKLMREDARFTGLHHFEGPERYSSLDVAKAFTRALGKPIAVEVIPKEKWIPYLLEMGYSKSSAQSMSNMTEYTLNNIYTPQTIVRGKTTIDDYIEGLVKQSVH